MRRKSKKRYDYIGRIHYEMFNSGDAGTRRILRRLVREAVKCVAQEAYLDHQQGIEESADRIAKELVP